MQFIARKAQSESFVVLRPAAQLTTLVGQAKASNPVSSQDCGAN